MTLNAPVRSSCVQCRRLAVSAGPCRGPQRRLAHQCGQIGDDETRCAFGDLVEVEVSRRNATQQHFQQLLADRAVGQAQAKLAVAQVGRAQPRVDVVGHR